jgi:hypothetical protein
MDHLGRGAYGAGVGGCKRRIFGGNMQSTSEKRCPSLTAYGGEMDTGMGPELMAYHTEYTVCQIGVVKHSPVQGCTYVRNDEKQEMKQVGNTDRSPLDDMWMKSGWGNLHSLFCLLHDVEQVLSSRL